MYEVVYYVSTLMSAFTFITLMLGCIVFRCLPLIRSVYVIMLGGFCLLYSGDLVAVYNEWIPWMRVQREVTASVMYSAIRQMVARIVIEVAIASPLYQYWKRYGRK